MGLKTIPSTIQLPGGVKLEALQLKVTEYADDGFTPKTFELLPPGSKIEKHGYVVYGSRAQFAYIKK